MHIHRTGSGERGNQECLGRTHPSGRLLPHQTCRGVEDLVCHFDPVEEADAGGAAATALKPGDHGSTFGGYPVSCAAALAVLTTIEEQGLLAHVRELGAHFTAAVAALTHPLVAGSRGIGLWHALVLTADVAADFEASARDFGFLVNAVRPNAIRIAPPLLITREQLDSFLAAVPAILDSIGA